jgi:hypothetical protein
MTTTVVMSSKRQAVDDQDSECSRLRRTPTRQPSRVRRQSGSLSQSETRSRKLTRQFVIRQGALACELSEQGEAVAQCALNLLCALDQGGYPSPTPIPHIHQNHSVKTLVEAKCHTGCHTGKPVQDSWSADTNVMRRTFKRRLRRSGPRILVTLCAARGDGIGRQRGSWLSSANSGSCC